MLENKLFEVEFLFTSFANTIFTFQVWTFQVQESTQEVCAS